MTNSLRSAYLLHIVSMMDCEQLLATCQIWFVLIHKLMNVTVGLRWQSKAQRRVGRTLPKDCQYFWTTSNPHEEEKFMYGTRVICVSSITFLCDYLCPIKIQPAYEMMVFSFMVMKSMIFHGKFSSKNVWFAIEVQGEIRLLLLPNWWKLPHWEKKNIPLKR